jgi:hypothetical protein
MCICLSIKDDALLWDKVAGELVGVASVGAFDMGIDRGDTMRHSNDIDTQKMLLEKFGITIEKIRFGPLIRVYPGGRMNDSDTDQFFTLRNQGSFVDRTFYEYNGAVDVGEIVSYTRSITGRGLNEDQVCLRGWIYVLYVGRVDKIMKPSSML